MNVKPKPLRRDRVYLLFAFCMLFSIFAALLIVRAPTHQEKVKSAYDLGYFVGPTTSSLLHGQGLLVCTDRMGTPGNPICFRSARMPMASIAMAIGVKVFGDNLRQIALAKSLLFMVPLWAVMAIVLRRASEWRGLVTCTLLLLSPFLIISFLIVMTSMEVEEGYFYGLFALSLTLVLFPFKRSVGWIVAIALTLDAIFLSKSSMLGVVLVLCLAALFILRSRRERCLLLLLVGLAPGSWAVYQHHVSHRYSIGTSLDGMNLHKGNNADFQQLYPSSNSRFDSFDNDLNVGLKFSDEWAFNDYHLTTGIRFGLSHPAFTLGSLRRKFSYLLFSINPYAATKMSKTLTALTSFGLILFRTLLWCSFGVAMYGTVTNRGVGRFNATVYFLCILAYVLPYFIGFGFMRHAVVLAYSSSILCCLAALGSARNVTSLQGGLIVRE